MAEAPRLRLLRVRITEATRAAGKPQYVVEKDYALSYLLAAIYDVDVLRQSLVFKGGTCLRKAYFAGYRFSEDLDFTARTPLACDELLSALSRAGARMNDLLEAYGTIHRLGGPRAPQRPPSPRPVRLPRPRPVPLDAQP